jgi:hypothetical protein
MFKHTVHIVTTVFREINTESYIYIYTVIV